MGLSPRSIVSRASAGHEFTPTPRPASLFRFALSVAALIGLTLAPYVAGQRPPALRPGTRNAKADEKRGLTMSDPQAFDGYTLLVPMKSTRTYLIDNQGREIHSWKADYWPGCTAKLLSNGDLLRPAALVGPNGNPVFGILGGGGRVQRFNWEGEKIWDFKYSTDEHMSHHDVEVLPNGNVLLLAWQRKSKKEAVEAGRQPRTITNELWVDHIVEVKPVGKTEGEIVWQWNIWDHLIQDFDSTKNNFGIVAKHSELLDINFVGQTEASVIWPDTNGIDYYPQLDQIILSMRSTSEVCIIDHSTTSQEAAGHTGGKRGKGGDFLFRWGNPQVYRKGTSADQSLFEPVDPAWIKTGYDGEGMISVFNSGGSRPTGTHSSVDVFAPPVDKNGNYVCEPGKAFGPSKLAWKYAAKRPTDFYSPMVGGAERLPNGNTFIVNGSSGVLFEVSSSGKTVWEFRNPMIGVGVAPGDPDDSSRSGKGARPAARSRPPDKTGQFIVFDAERYSKDNPAFVGRDLHPGKLLAPLESPFFRP